MSYGGWLSHGQSSHISYFFLIRLFFWVLLLFVLLCGYLSIVDGLNVTVDIFIYFIGVYVYMIMYKYCPHKLIHVLCFVKLGTTKFVMLSLHIYTFNWRNEVLMKWKRMVGKDVTDFNVKDQGHIDRKKILEEYLLSLIARLEWHFDKWKINW